MALDLFVGLRGRDDAGHERHAAFWTDVSSNPTLATYKAGAKGLLIPLYLQTAAAHGGSWDAQAYVLKGNDTLTRVDPTEAVTWLANTGVTYDWTVVGAGSKVTATQRTGPNLRTAVFSSPLIGTYAGKGAIAFLCSGGREVEVTDFHVPTASPAPSLGGLLAQLDQPGRFAGTTITYGFPAAGYAWADASTVAGYTNPLSAGWTAAPAPVQAGFRAAAAAWAAATGLTLTEATGSSAQVQVAVSPQLPGPGGFDGYAFSPTNGSVFVNPAIVAGSWAAGSYNFQIALQMLGTAAFGLHNAPSASAVDDPSLTVMRADATGDGPRWATGPRQADVDAARIDYDLASAP